MPRQIDTACCIAGGGPAGMMLGFLLARAGVDVVVLEKHADFLRDFRGDTIHPSTLQVMQELGLLDRLLQRPHQKVSELKGLVEDEEFVIADLSSLPIPYIALMPQWDFLNFLAMEAKTHPSFRLLMQTAAVKTVEEAGRVTGIEAQAPDGPLRINAALTVGADGRHSTLRAAAGLKVVDSGAPIDVLWMRLSHKETDPKQPLGNFKDGRAFIMLYRGDYWQCAYVIPKGGFDEIRRGGLEGFRAGIARVVPALRDRTDELRSWDDVKLLTVAVDHLAEWHRPGLLCLGDAAHAMSPIGGVGINLAIQDAIAAANFLAGPLARGRVTDRDLARMQRRRAWPARMTQRIQVFMHKNLFGSIGAPPRKWRLPPLLRFLLSLPFTRRIPAYIFGFGFRPEHVHTPPARS